jgi:hypothetical protein
MVYWHTMDIPSDKSPPPDIGKEGKRDLTVPFGENR